VVGARLASVARHVDVVGARLASVARRQDARMETPPPSQLLDRVRALPAAGPLLDRLGGHSGVHLVGGAVRDLLLGETSSDLDVAVEGDAAGLVEELGGTLIRHERFGTWTVALDGFTYDIAQARRETYRAPGALPEVSPATLEEDLQRRDFTVNAIALALTGARAGELTAAPGALEDLERRWLRVLHTRSFVEDPTRLLRLARYRNRLGFALESLTSRLAAQAVAQGALDTVSGPRIGAELRLLAAEGEPLGALLGLDELKLAPAIHPRFGLGRGKEPASLELGRRALALIPAGVAPDRLVLALAARDILAPELTELLDRLAFAADDRQAIVATATGAIQAAAALEQASRPSEIAGVAQGMPVELVALAGALGAEAPARSWLEHLRHVRLEIDGADLLRAGVPEGPAVGRGLRAALSAKLDGRAVGREAEVAAALEAANRRDSLP
jgi:tRNA nucleotidyltransferase (CCA-adding enzyme)